MTPKGTLTRHFVVAGTGFEPVTSGYEPRIVAALNGLTDASCHV
jgi:hypothetical protein